MAINIINRNTYLRENKKRMKILCLEAPDD